MNEDKDKQRAEPLDPLDQVIFELDAEQTAEFLRVLRDPLPASDALKAIMQRTPSWRRGSVISESFGLLERDGREPASIEEMKNAVLNQAAEDDERSKKR